MGIQSFTPSSGGLPGKSFIGNIFMTTSVQNWSQSGGPGYYTIISQGNNAGYVYFIGATTVGAPLNGIADLSATAGFTSIKIIGVSADACSLYKVAVKTTTSINTTATITTYSSSVTGATLASNKTGFIDALLVGGGGGGSGGHYGAGGGGGGVVLLQSYPLTPGLAFDVTVGAAGANGNNTNNGGNTLFAGARALGGGYGAHHHGNVGGSGGCGGGASSHQSENPASGKSIQGTGGGALATPLLFLSSFGGTASALGSGHDGAGGTGNGANHRGYGGGGAGGAAIQMNGGPGYLLSWNSQYYGSGGRGCQHSSNADGTDGTGWGGPGSGARNNGGSVSSSTIGTNGAVVIRSYDLV